MDFQLFLKFSTWFDSPALQALFRFEVYFSSYFVNLI